jgi:O-antigen/teichoic acid export membrane protein
MLAGEGLAAVLLLWWLGLPVRRAAVRVRLEVIRPLLPRAGALVLSALLGILIYNVDFIFLRIFRDVAAVGYYNAAYTLVTFFLNVGTAYSLSLLPSLTRLRETPTEQRRLYDTAMAHVFTAGLPIALGGSFLAGSIVGTFFGPGYAPAVVPFQLLIWCIPLCVLRDVPLMGLQAAGGEKRILRVTVLAAVLNLGLNVALIPRWGILGAAVATLGTEAVRMGVALSFAGGEGFGTRWLLRFWRPAAAAAAMAGALLLGESLGLAASVGLGGAVYLGVLVLVGGLRFRRKALPVLTV